MFENSVLTRFFCKSHSKVQKTKIPKKQKHKKQTNKQTKKAY